MSAGRYRESLPAAWYHDPGHFRRELDGIWKRQWLCVGRQEDWAEAGDFRKLTLDNDQVLVTRADDGCLRAFFNSCRHRGSVLCEAESGRFRNGRIVCPYHAWTYSLDGALLRAPHATAADSLRPEDFALHEAALECWRGFVFVNLADPPAASLAEVLADEASGVANWPLEDLRRVHRVRHRLGCNWKVFWENYLECYHCPAVHPDLCRLVPAYRTGRLDAAAADPRAGPPAMLRSGAVTWSADGATRLPWFDGLDAAEQLRGMTFADFVPTLFLVAHVDYVRSVRVFPLGPEATELTVEWFVHRGVLGHPDLDVPALVAFGDNLVQEDARVCELNQQGLRCSRHEHGVLLELEHQVLEFDQWVRQALSGTVEASA